MTENPVQAPEKPLTQQPQPQPARTIIINIGSEVNEKNITGNNNSQVR